MIPFLVWTATNLPVDPTLIGTWPAAVVAVVLILAVLVMPSVLSYLGNRELAKVKTTLTQNNGGSSVKDALDRIERKQAAQSQQLDDFGSRLGSLEAQKRKRYF